MLDIDSRALKEIAPVFAIMLLLGGAFIVWAVWIRSYLRRAGRRPGFPLFNWSALVDYRQARMLADEKGYVPWFLRLFEILFELACIIGTLLMIRLIVNYG